MSPQPWIKTPLIPSDALSKAAGCNIFLKLELLQPSGSFKSRGIGNLMIKAIKAYEPGRPVHFYCSSGGNAGLACVTAAKLLGQPATVVVPILIKEGILTKIRGLGGEVVQIGANWAEADSHLRTELIPKDPDGIYVPPFDHPDVWTGHSTMVDELADQLITVAGCQRPDGIVCSVGGGGLFNGIMQGLDKHSWSDVSVLTMETVGTESLNASITAKELVTLPGITSIATSLGATRVSTQSFDYGLRPSVVSKICTDQEAVAACWRFLAEHRMLVEPACSVCFVPCYDGSLRAALEQKSQTPWAERNIVIVVCGGSNIGVEMLQAWST